MSKAGWVVAAVLAACALANTPGAALADANLPGRDCNARFNCLPGDSPRCWFRIAMSRGTMSFVLPAGHSRTIYGLTRGDVVCDSNRGPPRNGPAGHCREIRMICERN